MNAISIRNIIERTAKDGSVRTIYELYLPSRFISLTDAYKQYGRDAVKRWIKEGLLQITPSAKGKRSKMLERKQLEAISSSSNRATYLPVRERK